MEAAGSQGGKGIESMETRSARRILMLRDGLTFLWLTLVALALGAVTTLLFRSFEAHREALGLRWAQRGRYALQHGQYEAAVAALRTSLSYHPDDRDNELALAGALAAAKHTTEAENYYGNLWQARPGDGLVNLQLARLERSMGHAESAINYYRAAIFGTWSGDAVPRRRSIRLELSDYLVERGQTQAARAELLIAAGNNTDAASQLTIGEALERANDMRDAMTAYRNAMDDPDRGDVAKAKAGELCYRAGDYACASDLLEKVLRHKGWTEEQQTRIRTLQSNASRLMELSYSRDLSAAVRASHLMNDARIADARLRSCGGSAAAADASGALAVLQARWKTVDTTKNRDEVKHDDDVQDAYVSLINDTEIATMSICGAPTGGDALLLRLREHPATRFGVQ